RRLRAVILSLLVLCTAAQEFSGEIPLWKRPATFRVAAGDLRVLPVSAMRRAARWPPPAARDVRGRRPEPRVMRRSESRAERRLTEGGQRNLYSGSEEAFLGCSEVLTAETARRDEGRARVGRVFLRLDGSLAAGELREVRRVGPGLDVGHEVGGVHPDERLARAAGALMVELGVLVDAFVVVIDGEDAGPDPGYLDGDRVGIADVAYADGSPSTVDHLEI